MMFARNHLHITIQQIMALFLVDVNSDPNISVNYDSMLLV